MIPVVASVLVVLLLASWSALRLRQTDRFGRLRPNTKPASLSPNAGFSPAKPTWVRCEVIRLKAWMPDAGCRRVATTFNQLYEERRGMTVGKTYVAAVLRQAGEEVMRLRRKLRRRKPRRFARNVLWGLDWTYVPGEGGRSLPVLGVVDCGTRACLELATVESKKTVVLLRHLLELFERFGRPKVIRTDNEPVCRSWLFRAVLRIVGVKHVRTAPFAPWQNGRIERLFGTVKRVLRQHKEMLDKEEVSRDDLRLVRGWYNHLRPHQGLDGKTPAEAWSGKQPDRRHRPIWISEWNGLLSGYRWTR